MNCPECGHLIAMHSKYLRACQNHSCKCELTPEEIELHYWRSEAMAGRALVEFCHSRVSPQRLTEDGARYDKLRQTYLAARVPDATEPTP